MASVQNTKEVIKFVTVLGVLIGHEVASDGLQITDLLKLFDNAEFRQKAADALADITLVPEELSDLSLAEGFELSMAALESSKEILAAFQGQAA